MEPHRAGALLVALLWTLPLAGCMAESGGSSQYGPNDDWSYSAGGQGYAEESATLQARQGRVSAQISVGGQASIHLIVRDDDGDTVIRLECTGSGGCSKSRTADHGDTGTWHVDLQGLYQGGVSASVTVW